MKKRDVDETIIEYLKENGKTQSNELKKIIIEKTGIAKSTYNYRLKNLYKLKKIKRNPTNWGEKCAVYYYIEDESQEILNKYVLDECIIQLIKENYIDTEYRLPKFIDITNKLILDDANDKIRKIIYNRLQEFNELINKIDGLIKKLSVKADEIPDGLAGMAWLDALLESEERSLPKEDTIIMELDEIKKDFDEDIISKIIYFRKWVYKRKDIELS